MKFENKSNVFIQGQARNFMYDYFIGVIYYLQMQYEPWSTWRVKDGVDKQIFLPHNFRLKHRNGRGKFIYSFLLQLRKVNQDIYSWNNTFHLVVYK